MGYDAWENRVEQLVTLAFIDESEQWEVDQNGIYYDAKAPSGKEVCSSFRKWLFVMGR